MDMKYKTNLEIKETLLEKLRKLELVFVEESETSVVCTSGKPLYRN